MATVRLQDDVNTQLKAAAAADPAGRSATQLADHLLRVGLGMVAVDPPAAPDPPAKAARAPAGPARLGRPGRARPARPAQATCPHPVGRRIGSVCMACGREV